MGLSKKSVTSRPAFVFSPVSLKQCENTAIRKMSEQVFQTFRTSPFNQGIDTKNPLCKDLFMTIKDLKDTANMAHLNSDESGLTRIFPSFAEMIGFFDTMLAAEDDKAAFPDGLAPVSTAIAGASGNYRTVNSGFYSNAVTKDNSSLSESLLNNAAERDGRFFVVPNVL